MPAFSRTIGVLLTVTVLGFCGVATIAADAPADSNRAEGPPGAPEMTEELRQKLSAAVIAKGEDYEPRTRHRRSRPSSSRPATSAYRPATPSFCMDRGSS